MQHVVRFVTLAALVLSLFGLGAAVPAAPAASAGGPVPMSLIADWQVLAAGPTPPSQAACNAVSRRCFNPQAMQNSYNLGPLYAMGNRGQGKTIAVIDSFGSDVMTGDLKVFNNAFGLPHMCGEPGVTCTPGMPTFSRLAMQGAPPTNPPPPNNGTGQENHNLWALEVALDVEWAHSIAPLANIVLVTTPTAETLGVQGFPQMMNAIQYIVDNHLADVISMSLGSGEANFQGQAALMQLRKPFEAARAAGITVFASTGDGGTSNNMKEPVKNPAEIPYPSVGWPASDPLVTAVGGTYLCTDAATGLTVDTVSPPANCRPTLNPLLQRETGWIDSGGGYSIFFGRPDYQNALPPGSTFVGSSAGAPGPNQNMRGIPDIAYQASSRTGVLVYMTLPDTTQSGVGCGGANPCSTGWYVVGGTSASSPQWAAIVAIADQTAGRDLGFINPALYKLALNPAKYAADFFDVTVGCNQTTDIPGYCASKGWDAVTGLGTPNAAKLVPDLIAATP